MLAGISSLHIQSFDVSSCLAFVHLPPLSYLMPLSLICFSKETRAKDFLLHPTILSKSFQKKTTNYFLHRASNFLSKSPWHIDYCCTPGSQAALISVTGWARLRQPIKLWAKQAQRQRYTKKHYQHLNCQICKASSTRSWRSGYGNSQNTPDLNCKPQTLSQVKQGQWRNCKVERGRSEVVKLIIWDPCVLPSPQPLYTG